VVTLSNVGPESPARRTTAGGNQRRGNAIRWANDGPMVGPEEGNKHNRFNAGQEGLYGQGALTENGPGRPRKPK